MSDDGLTEQQLQIKKKLEGELGYWGEGLEATLRRDPRYLGLLADVAVDCDDGGGLDEEMRELTRIAVYASPPNYDERGLRRHVRNALNIGVDEDRIFYVMEVVAAIGNHCSVAAADGIEQIKGELDVSDEREEKAEAIFEQQEELRDRSDEMQALIRSAPDYFLDGGAHGAHLGKRGEDVMEKKNRQLMGIAVDASLAHTFELGLENHIKNAVEAGATLDEIVDVFRILYVIEANTLDRSVAVLEEEVERHEE